MLYKIKHPETVEAFQIVPEMIMKVNYPNGVKSIKTPLGYDLLLQCEVGDWVVGPEHGGMMVMNNDSFQSKYEAVI